MSFFNNCVVAHASAVERCIGSIVYGNRRYSIVSTVETNYLDNEVMTVVPYYTWVFITNKGAQCENLKTSTDMRTAVMHIPTESSSILIVQNK